MIYSSYSSATKVEEEMEMISSFSSTFVTVD